MAGIKYHCHLRETSARRGGCDRARLACRLPVGGEILSMADGTGTTTNVYDSRRLTTQTDGAGHAVSYSYDLSGRLTGIAYPGGTCVTPTSLCVTRTYDNDGRLSTISDWLSHQTSYGYDANSNLTGIT